MVDLSSITGFEWDEGNQDKNWLKHRVATSEREETFFNIPLLVRPNQLHSQSESRYFILGRSNAGRYLFIAFTLRMNQISVISARDMSQKERASYEQANS